MVSIRLGNCTVCGSEELMKFQCKNCQRWSCGKQFCLDWMGSIRDCRVPKRFLPGEKYHVAQELKF